MPAQTWEVRVRGQIPPALLLELGAVSLAEEPAQTVLRTAPLDQAALHGVLERLRNLGLDLVELRPLPAAAPSEPE